jgi:hypothetical protein
MNIRTHQAADSVNGDSFVGITYIASVGYIALGRSVSKTFKTEKGARKFLRKYGYDC